MSPSAPGATMDPAPPAHSSEVPPPPGRHGEAVAGTTIAFPARVVVGEAFVARAPAGSVVTAFGRQVIVQDDGRVTLRAPDAAGTHRIRIRRPGHSAAMQLRITVVAR